MAETKEQNKGKKLGLSRPGKLELKKTVKTGQVRQSFSHGRSKMVTVEVRKKRTFAPDAGGHMTEVMGELEQPDCFVQLIAKTGVTFVAFKIALGRQSFL